MHNELDPTTQSHGNTIWERLKYGWLNISIITTALGWTGTEIYLQHRKNGGGLGDSFNSFMQDLARRRGVPSEKEILFALIIQAVLIWFTFFSGSRYVSKTDKLAVKMMLGGAAVGWIGILLRYAFSK